MSRFTFPSDGLAAPVRTALDGLRMDAFDVAHTPEGRTLKTIFAAYHNTTQSINSATWTPVNFNAQTDLRGVNGVKVPVGVHDNAVSPSQFVVPRVSAGLVRVRTRLTFGAHATGIRGIRLTKNGTAVSWGMQAAAGVASLLVFRSEFSVSVAGGDVLGIEAFQDSGGALNIGLTGTREAENEIEIEFP